MRELLITAAIGGIGGAVAAAAIAIWREQLRLKGEAALHVVGWYHECANLSTALKIRLDDLAKADPNDVRKDRLLVEIDDLVDEFCDAASLTVASAKVKLAFGEGDELDGVRALEQEMRRFAGMVSGKDDLAGEFWDKTLEPLAQETLNKLIEGGSIPARLAKIRCQIRGPEW